MSESIFLNKYPPLSSAATDRNPKISPCLFSQSTPFSNKIRSFILLTMPKDYTVGKTSVFWDVVDFPVPEGRGIREIVESALRRMGYKGEVSITVYGDKDPFSPEETAKGRFTFVERIKKYWRLNKMLVDIGWWSMETPEPHYNPANVVVVAKNIKEATEFVYFLRGLRSSNFNVLLVVPDDCEPEELPLPTVNLAWYWTSFVQGGEPMPRTELKALIARGRPRVVL